MGVAVLDVGVGDHHVGALAAEDRDQATDGLVERRLGEAAGVLVLRHARHARVAVAQPHDLGVAEDLGGLGQLLAAHAGEVGPHLLGVHRRVEDVAGLAARAADEHAPHPGVAEERDRAGALGGFVVGVGVHRQQAQRPVVVGHAAEELVVRHRPHATERHRDRRPPREPRRRGYRSDPRRGRRRAGERAPRRATSRRRRRGERQRMEDPETWRWIWLATAVIFVLGEMAIAGSFFLAPFAVGAAVAACWPSSTSSLGGQWLAFVGISVGSFAGLRPLVPPASTRASPPTASARSGSSARPAPSSRRSPPGPTSSAWCGCTGRSGGPRPSTATPRSPAPASRSSSSAAPA